ncbi:hypothetical protein [Rhizobium leguminosarum]|uniref:hypothetical protein n=1 Tax=Rhizobium leguminosarum TaxID=384 RepID=UPI00103E2813|nr:hypothetical protein [Rhizobium leguminosarum]MBY5794924.1 hypothetical protein [Rhizobium leguminosarum]NKK26963.1 hypothetical protein [Rhizobium leguminosarum bv. viciae]NKK68097.1 hypothetical protein [Rhizobium leguminosarum bv. viciae]TBZ97478.1 hypothetical protein E0H57_31050 [Rhizobium leguminosarum bv. viciae]
MENLWPNDLLAEMPGLIPNAIETILEIQALGLGTITGGLVVGRVRDRSFPPNRAWSLYIEPVDQPSKAYEFLIIRSVDGGYPVAVEAYHLGEARLKRCESKATLTKALQKIFADPSSKSVIRTLAEEAMAAGAVVRPQGETQVQPARPIEISPVFDTPDGPVSSISMFGISGHISDTTLENLRDRHRRVVEPLNDRFVVTMPFVGTVKTTVSKEELDVLVAQAKQSLKGY